MLGSIDFFKNEFAIPIDKMQDEIAKNTTQKTHLSFLIKKNQFLLCGRMKHPKKIFLIFFHVSLARCVNS